MPYAYECSKFDDRCPEGKDVIDCFWCFKRSINKQLFDAIAEHDTDASAPLSEDFYYEMKEETADGMVDMAVKECPHGVVEHMLFHYGFYEAVRLYERNQGESISSVATEEKHDFYRFLLVECVSFEMNKSIHDFYRYQSTGRLEPEYDC